MLSLCGVEITLLELFDLELFDAFDHTKKKFLHFLGVVADAKWSELTMSHVACLLRVFLL